MISTTNFMSIQEKVKKMTSKLDSSGKKFKKREGKAPLIKIQ